MRSYISNEDLRNKLDRIQDAVSNSFSISQGDEDPKRKELLQDLADVWNFAQFGYNMRGWDIDRLEENLNILWKTAQDLGFDSQVTNTESLPLMISEFIKGKHESN